VELAGVMIQDYDHEIKVKVKGHLKTLRISRLLKALTCTRENVFAAPEFVATYWVLFARYSTGLMIKAMV
jgi:hypothetical protein